MDLYGKLQLKWSLGYDGSPLLFVDSSTLVYGSGNALCFTDCSGRHVRSLPSLGSGVGPIATAPRGSTLVYAESTLRPRLFAVSYPSNQLLATLEGGAELEFVSLAISNSGKRLASLSGAPDFLLVLWDVVEGCELCRASVGPGCSHLSLNPLNWRQLCVLGVQRLTLYLLEECDDSQLVLTPLETNLPEISAEVGSAIQPPLLPLSVTHVQSKASETEQHTTKEAHSGPNLPDLSKVLYQETYDEYTRERRLVVLASHCWSTQQSMFVGCRGGQLLTVDFDTGVIKTLANPQLSVGREVCSTGVVRGEGGGEPHTAHAVLCEGSLECLALGKRGLFTAGKDGVVYCFAVSPELQVIELHTVSEGDSICSLSWSPDYTRLAIGTQQTAIYVTDPLQLSACSLLSPPSHSPIVSLDMLTPGSDHIVTCRADGMVQVWSVADASLVSSLSLKHEAHCVVCPMSCHVAIVGCSSGHVCVVDLNHANSPRLVARMRLYRSPVTHIRSDLRALFFVVTSSSDPNVFVCSGLVSKGVEVLGHTGVRGGILDLSVTAIEPGDEGSTLITALSRNDDQTLLTQFQVPNSTEETTLSGLYRGEFSSETILKREMVLSIPVSLLIVCSPTTAFAVANSSSDLAKFCLPLLEEKEANLELSPGSIITAHDGGRVHLGLSFHQKWVASAGSDGRLFLRLAEHPEKTVACKPHHYRNNGCSALVLSKDSQHIITIGDRNTISCWTWEFTNHGSVKAQTAGEYLQRVLQSLSGQHSRENSVLETLTPLTDQPAEGENTWLETAEEQVHRVEDEKYSDLKSELRREIGGLRERLLEMMGSNEEAPELERLGREEFILDMEEQERLQREEDEQIRLVREEIELSSLAKRFLKQQIKNECWDSMAVKGRVIKGFQGSLEVSSYPMMQRSERELGELERVCALRTVEKADREARNEIIASLRRATEVQGLDDEGEEGREEETQGKGEGEERDASALYGSHGPKFGGGCELLYTQFELQSPVAKRHQIVLLKGCMYRIAETFNKEFEEVARLKLAEIARIREKNVRISKIIQQLQLTEEQLVQPVLQPVEQPEEMLTVQDEEVLVEKYLSPEEQQKQDEAARLEEERRLAEMGDNPRERALDMMMGGRLEANVEEDLFKDLPRPDFMQKDPAERTEEEIRAALEFEKKEAAFLEEREKLKKALEGELRKLQSSIAHAMDSFDERLHKLFDLKINTEMVMHQEQLKVVGLVSALQVEEEVAGREKQLNTLLQEKKNLKSQLAGVVNTAKNKIEEYRELYDQMLADDKTLDRNFKRDFSDCEPFVDQLYKLFKRRPRGQRLKQGASDGGLVLDPKSQNPFPHRPPTATGGQRLVGKVSEDEMSELDHPSHMPEGVDPSQWDRLVGARHRKWDSETKARGVALKLAEMESFLKRRLVEEERLQSEIQDAFSELNRLSEEKTLFNQDLAVQLLLKQGQVEVEEGEFVPDYTSSVLVHRSVIEELNKEIKTHGEGKLASMNECKDFKRGIRLQEWECSRLKMQVEDLQEQAREVQLLRVTKDLQLSLSSEEGHGGRDQHEIETLEKTLEINERTHKKKVREKKKHVARLQVQREKRRGENRELDQALIEKQVSVLERQAAEKLAGVAPSEAGVKQRMADIVSRRRMVELARAQATEIQVLRGELERLRMATFPALVQVD